MTAAPAKVIPPIHPDTIAFEQILTAFKFGERISYEALAKHVRKNMKEHGDRVHAHLQSAERRLRNAKQMVFGAYHIPETGERGRERLDDAGIIDKASHQAGRLGRAAKRIERIAGCANYDALTEDQRNRQATVMVAARGAAKFTEDKGRQKILRIVSNSAGRIPELANVWAALQQ